MGWGQVPSEAKAAEEARREAIERAENRPMSPFERKLIDVLEDIRDHVAHPMLSTERVAVEADGVIATAPTRAEAESVLIRYADGSVHDLGRSVYLSTVDPDPLAPLLDSPPDVLTRAVQAGGAALSNSFPMFREDLTATGFEKFAEVAIEAALHEAARDTPPRWGHFDLRLDPVSPAQVVEQCWRGPGIYTLISNAAETQVSCLDQGALEVAIAGHPIVSPWPEAASEVQQGAEEEAGDGEPPAGPSPAAP